mgnify:CR=1 FL=1
MGGGQLGGAVPATASIATTCPDGTYAVTDDGLSTGANRYCYACPVGYSCTGDVKTACANGERAGGWE